MKKTYSDKIRREHAKYTIPARRDEVEHFGGDVNADLNQEAPAILVKPAVDGTTIGRSDVYTVEAPKTGGMKMRKTAYVFADR